MKKVIAALVLGLLIGSAGSAFAASSEAVQAVFSKFALKIDDQKPVVIEALVQDGTSYLPVRIIAELLGREVAYEESTKTIELNSKGVEKMNEAAAQPEKLSDVNKDEWVIYAETLERFGINYIPKATGETVIKKGDLEFELPTDVAKNDISGEVFTDGQTSIRIKVVFGSIFYNIEDLKKAGFID